MDEKMLKQYADLLIFSGLDLQEGEGLIISVAEDGLALARQAAAAAYQRGAKDVEIIFMDDALTLTRYQHGFDSIFDLYPEYKALYLKHLYDDHYQHMFINSPDPQLLKDIPSDKVSRSQRSRSKMLKETGVMAYRMTDKTRWTIGAMPSNAWASLIFPNIPAEEAKEKLWQAICTSIRLDQPDPIAAWKEHDRRLKYYRDFLNRHSFEKMHYQAPGTDLEVCLADGHWWEGGSKTGLDGVSYLPNIPTEEVFSAPHCDKVNGTLRATMPLSLNGNLINGIQMEFEKGKVVRFSAETGEDVLAEQLSQDEGAARLGEIAIVPASSPIAKTGLIFQNTLYDENASCHFALGQSYGFCMQNSQNATPEELRARGANDSMIHTDFMVGSSELQITGYTHQGQKMVILEKGEWAI